MEWARSLTIFEKEWTCFLGSPDFALLRPNGALKHSIVLTLFCAFGNRVVGTCGLTPFSFDLLILSHV